MYGALFASFSNFKTSTEKRKYAGYHLALAARYIVDLSQPLHNTLYYAYNRRNRVGTDATINDEVPDTLGRIKTYPIVIESEEDLASDTNAAIPVGSGFFAVAD